MRLSQLPDQECHTNVEGVLIICYRPRLLEVETPTGGLKRALANMGIIKKPLAYEHETPGAAGIRVLSRTPGYREMQHRAEKIVVIDIDTFEATVIKDRNYPDGVPSRISIQLLPNCTALWQSEISTAYVPGYETT